jgi:hypothetical protein
MRQVIRIKPENEGLQEYARANTYRGTGIQTAQLVPRLDNFIMCAICDAGIVLVEIDSLHIINNYLGNPIYRMVSLARMLRNKSPMLSNGSRNALSC